MPTAGQLQMMVGSDLRGAFFAMPLAALTLAFAPVGEEVALTSLAVG